MIFAGNGRSGAWNCHGDHGKKTVREGGVRMQSYQKEYVENLRSVAELTAVRPVEGMSFTSWYRNLQTNWAQAAKICVRSMEILRTEFRQTIDNLFSEGGEDLEGLEEFAAALVCNGDYLDSGLYCTIHQALLSFYRTRKMRDGIIRELYFKGMGLYSQTKMLFGIDHPVLDAFDQRFRMCFAEAGAYRKYFDEIESEETKGYIIRAMANVSLGRFQNKSDKIAIVRRTIQVLSDDWYKEFAPGLPWDRFLYLTHQQMVSGRALFCTDFTPQDLVDLMESSHVLYNEQLETVERDGGKPNPRFFWPYCEMEYMCGLTTIQEMLGKLEMLIEQASEDDQSVDGMYAQITLPMTYCSILEEFADEDFMNRSFANQHFTGRDLIWNKREYLQRLNERAFWYVGGLPADQGHAFYLNQFISAYIELDGCPPYDQVLLTVLGKCTPDIYVRSWMIAKVAVAICETVMEDEPQIFDGVPAVANARGVDAKRTAALQFVQKGGMLHDVGILPFYHIHSIRNRELFQEELELLRLHTCVGWEMLKKRKSTREYADLALGHHAWYNGAKGYPDEYKRRESPCRCVVDLITLASFLTREMDSDGLFYRTDGMFDEAIAEAVREEGHRFYPPLTVSLQNVELQKKLREIFRNGVKEACRRLYDGKYGIDE